MPLFYFNPSDAEADQDGTELVSASQARAEAVRLAGHLIAEQCLAFRDGGAWNLEVTDKAGTVLFRLDFKATGGIERNDFAQI